MLNKEVKEMKDQKKIDFIKCLLYVLLFVLSFPAVIVYGAVMSPIRYFKYVSAEVHDKEPEKYYF